jgi:hypothetical protein
MEDGLLDDLSPEAVRAVWERIHASPDKRLCFQCASLVWPKGLAAERQKMGWPPMFPVCVDHPDSSGVPREVDLAQGCPNFRAIAKPAVRGEPPEPQRPTDRFIPLTRGLWAVVDVKDFERLNKYRWYASPSGGGKMYARRSTRTGTISMHREIMNPPKGMQVDHWDHNGLNNRPDNLRNCTPQQNQWNRSPRGKKSRFKGVYPSGGKWCAMIKHKGKSHYLGTFEDEAEAARARDRKAYELEGEYAYLNFPDEVAAISRR